MQALRDSGAARGHSRGQAIRAKAPVGRRRGFTLVELLTVIVIIGILAAVLLPAIQAARESARRTTCTNNIRQLGQGLQLFHDARGSLPVGSAAHPIYNSGASYFNSYKSTLTTYTGATMYSVYTWVVGTLPYIEEKSLYSKFDLKGQSNSATNSPLVQTPLPILICPSDPDSATPIMTRRGLAANNNATTTDASGYQIHGLWYAGSTGPSSENGANQFCPTGSTAWCWLALDGPNGESGVLDMGNQIGMFGARYMPTKFKNALDGLSKTFLLVETQPKDAPQNAAYANGSGSLNANALISLSAPINMPIPSKASPFRNAVGQWDGTMNIYSKSPRSAHPGGCQMLMCDGAVVFLTETTPLQLLCQLGHRADGEVASVP